MVFCLKLIIFFIGGNFVVMIGNSVIKGTMGVVLLGIICSFSDKLGDAVFVRIFSSMVVVFDIFCLVRKIILKS